MCQLNKLTQLFTVWNADATLGIRQLDKRLKSFSLRKLMQDSDCDGLPDMLEARLLEKFRPYFKFSTFAGVEEKHRPADVAWYVRNCQVVMEESGGLQTIISNEEFRNSPENILNLSLQKKDDTLFPTDILHNPRRTNTHLTVPENLRAAVWAGVSWDEVVNSGNVGLYGHVVPIYFDVAENAKKKYIKIEYWFFCPYNVNGAGGLEHESDWMTVQLIYDPEKSHADKIPLKSFEDTDPIFPSDHLYSVIHWHHGEKSEFRIQNAMQVFQHTTDTGTQFLGLRVNSDQIMFFQDPDSKAWSHPVVYISYGNHEFFPTGEGNHNGGGFSFLTSTPPNVGEIEYPVTAETEAAILILRFNGFWGLHNNVNPPPPGPILHHAWSWLPSDPNFADNPTRIAILNGQTTTGNKYFE